MCMRLVITALLVLGSLAGCGGEERPAPSSSVAGADLPRCSTVWAAGATLPADYTACVEGGRRMEPKEHECDNGKSSYLEQGDGEAFARRGGPVATTLGELARICD